MIFNHIFTIVTMNLIINLSIINHLTLRQVTSMLTVASIHLARERPLDALRSAKDHPRGFPRQGGVDLVGGLEHDLYFPIYWE